MRRFVSASLLSVLALGWAGCVSSADEQLIDSEVSVPPRGGADTLDVGEWNLEWFGSTGNGPSNEGLQLANVRSVLRGADLDLWGLEEVVNQAQFEQLKAQLPGYDGFLANDPRVTSGSTYYSTNEQKVGVLFKSSVITVRAARLILTANDSDFGGRPPLELEVTATIDGAATDLVFIVLHAKALADSASYQRRVAAAAALKAYLDGTRRDARVIAVGDYNDDLDVSIYNNLASPYQAFVDDAAGYALPTKVFSDTDQQTTVSNAQAIDHHILSNEAAPLYLDGSAEVFRVDSYITSYGKTTSDHYPTLTRYRLVDPTAPGKLMLNEILANEPGSDVAAEFVELVNVGGRPVDASGYTLSDSVSVRHTFAAGTMVAPGKALTVFGGASAIPAGVAGVAASTGQLGLNNTTDTVTLRDAAGASVDSFAYPATLSAADGVSMNRSPDGDPAGMFVLHDTLGALPASPGTRASGAAF